MITGGKITYVEAKRENDQTVNGLNLNIGLDDVAVKGDAITIQYTFVTNYDDKVGHLKIVGVLYATEERSKAKEIEELWKRSKRLPPEFAEVVLNTINYTCGINGTFVVQPVRLSPPMQLPRVRVELEPPQDEKKSKKEKSAA